MKQAILCIGHTTLDTFFKIEQADVHCDIDIEVCKVCFDFGSKIPIEHVEYGVGGGAANIAAGTAKLGVETALYTVIGSGYKGDDIMESLTTLGVNGQYVTRDNYPTDQAMIVSYTDERTIFTFNQQRKYTLPSFNVREFPYIVLSSIGNDVEHTYTQVINLKQENPDIVLIYNPGSRELMNAYEDIERIREYIDYLIVNVEEGATILNKGLKRDQIEIEDMMGMLIEKGVGHVILTDGKNGVYVAEYNSFIHVPSIAVEVVEMTGAGDAFASGFISAITHGEPLEEAALWGTIQSSSVIKVIGAQEGLLGFDDLSKRADDVKKDRARRDERDL